MRNQPQLSIDEQAARMAEQMLSKGGAAGDLPEGRKEAEGGFTEDAGGQLIDAGQKGNTAMKSQKTGSKMIGEPGREGRTPPVTTAITDEPDRQEAGARAGEGGNLDTDADDMARKRKSGKIGISGGDSAGSGMSEDEDAKTRARKPGRIGIQGQSSESFGKGEAFGGKKAPPFGKKEGEEDEDEAKKGARLSPDAAKKACGMKKGDDEDEDEEGGGKDEEGEEGEDTEKGMVDVDTLMKSLDTLEAIAEGASIPVTRDRRAELAEKLAEGSLSKGEMRELHELTKSEESAGETEEIAEEPMVKSYQEQFAEEPMMAEGYDVSPFLERQSQLLAASLDQIQERMAKSLEGQNENSRAFNIGLAKSLRGMAQLSKSQTSLIKALAERLEVVENQPLPRRGHSNVRTLSKSMAGEVGAGNESLTRVQVLDTLEAMAMKMDYAPCGVKLTDAVAGVEGGGDILKSLMNDVVKFRGNGVR